MAGSASAGIAVMNVPGRSSDVFSEPGPPSGDPASPSPVGLGIRTRKEFAEAMLRRLPA